MVSRDQELARLHAMLASACAGTGNIVLIAGDAGSGKSSLVRAFGDQALAANPELLLTTNACDAQVGTGIPYAPFREALADLVQATTDRNLRQRANRIMSAHAPKSLDLIIAIVEKFGPDLINLLVPGSVLVAKMGQYALEKSGVTDKVKKRIKPGAQHIAVPASGLSQDQVIEQYVNVMRGVSKHAPLVMVIEDLHWADPASIEMLFRFSRRLADCRLMVVGTYRPLDLARSAGEPTHPLSGVLDEIRRYQGDVFIDLNKSVRDRGRAFVDALLDAEPNRLDEAFRSQLYGHTDGHPLFTVELLRDMQARGTIVRDAHGRWAAQGAVDWSEVPAKVEGVLAARVAMLTPELTDELSIASVEGEHFSAEIVASVARRDVRDAVRTLSGAAQRMYQLVEAIGVVRVGALRLSRYVFSHVIFQRYLYSRIDSVERAHLHEAIGGAIESMYGAQAGETAAQLARHFLEAGLPDRAQPYLRHAADQAAASYANDVALDYYGRALQLAPADDVAGRLALLLGRERVLNLLGRRDAQRADLDALAALADRAQSPPLVRAQVALLRASMAKDISDYPAALAQCVEVARELDAAGLPAAERSALLAGTNLVAGGVRLLQGQPALALPELEDARRAARESGDAAGETRALELIGSVNWMVGDYPKARACLTAALTLAESSGDLRRQIAVLTSLATVASLSGALPEAMQRQNEALELARRIGDRPGETKLLCNLSDTLLDLWDLPAAHDSALAASDMAAELGDRYLQAVALINLGEARRESGDYEAARATLHQALAIAQEIGYRRGAAVAMEKLGYVALSQGAIDDAVALAQRASGVADELGFRQRQLLAAVLLANACAAAARGVDAVSAWAQARQMSSEIGDDALQAETVFGRAMALVGNPADPDTVAALAAVGAWVPRLLAEDETSLIRRLPARALLACARALEAGRDARLDAVVHAAAREVRRRSEHFADPVTRTRFREQVPEHRVILRYRLTPAARPT